MPTEPSDTKLVSDTPLIKPKDDQLGYAPFAEDLANTINAETPGEEFVIGIYGPWGSGKSTALNFLEHYLTQANDPPVTIRFNPWWFSGQADLLERFFGHLESGLKNEDDFNRIRVKLSNFSSALSNVPLSVVTGVPTQRPLLFLSRWLDPEPADVEELKQDISEDLEDVERRIVVFLDDIDRLAEEEMAQMFRLVKSVADFPNITYVLAFDHNVVANSLEREHVVEDGEEYLDKIIQLPQHLPVPEEGSLDEFFVDRLLQVVGDEGLKIDQNHWQTVYKNGILPTLKTPRDGVRLSNSINTSYKRLGEEVNFVDLVSVETLRLFYTSAYEYIREHPEEFINERGTRRLKDEDDYSDFFEEYSSSAAERQWLTEILTYLFPRVDSSSFMGSRYSEDHSTFRKRKRICHPEIFPFYFRQTVPSGEITSEELESLIAVSDNPEEFADELQQLTELEGRDGRSKANRFLKRFTDYTDELDRGQAKGVIKALFIAGDELCAVDPSISILDGGSRNQIRLILLEILKDIEDRRTRLDILKESIRDGESLYISSLILTILYREHGKMGGDKIEEEERLLNSSQLKELTSVWVTNVEKTAETGDLLATSNLDIVLDRWIEWTNSDKPQQWVEENTEDTDDLLRFLHHFIKHGSYSSISRSGIESYFNPEWLEPFLDPAKVEERLENLDYDQLEEWEQQTVELFRRGKKFLDKGKDPSDFSLWHIGERGK